MGDTNKDITNGRELLTFEKIIRHIIRNEYVGYWLLGFILIVAWNATGFLSTFQYGMWIFEPPRVVLSTNFLLFFTLVSLRYLRKVFITTLKEYRISIKSYEMLFNKKVGWFLFFLLVGNQSWWFLNEYTYLLYHPEVIGTLPYRGANLGLPLLLYCTVISTILFVIFVDLIAIGVTISTFPFKIKEKLKVNIISEDKSGGNAKIGNLLLAYIKVYFVLLVLATLGRYSGINHPMFWYYLVLVIIAWLFGILLFFFPMYPIKKQINIIKSKKLKEIEQKLGNSLENLEFDKLSPQVILLLLKLKDDITNVREYPINFQILKEFVFYCLLPILSNIVMVLIDGKIR